jgi:hypothetical protein
MIPAAARLPVLLAALAAAWQPSSARAADENTQFWFNQNVTGKIADRTTLTIDATQRLRDANDGDQQTLRVTLEQEIADAMEIGGGVGVFETGGETEIRVTQQITATPGRFELRSRLEERFFDGADRMELRLRKRVHYNQPIAPGWRATGGVEWLALLQSRNKGEGFSTDQWRFQAIVTHEVSKNLDVGAIYWLVVEPRGGQADRISHIPQAVVTYRF